MIPVRSNGDVSDVVEVEITLDDLRVIIAAISALQNGGVNGVSNLLGYPQCDDAVRDELHRASNRLYRLNQELTKALCEARHIELPKE